jgi:UDP-N-acetylmuramate dehydrogenase
MSHVLKDEPLARHLPSRTGGPCHAYAVAHCEEEVLSLLSDLPGPVMVLGCGTRTLARDGGFGGSVLRLGVDFCGVQAIGDGGLRVGAGTPIAALASLAAELGLSGVEKLCTRAGSVGASLRLDPGWEGLVGAVRFVRRGRICEGSLTAARAPRAVILSCELNLRSMGMAEVQAKTRNAWRRRPDGPPGAWFEVARGSVRAVLRASALDAVRVRRAALPRASPETVVNLGGAPSADLALLQRTAEVRVRERTGIKIASRMKWIGTRLRRV